MTQSKSRETLILELAQELENFLVNAEETLKKIEENMDENKNLFSVFAEKMFTVKGAAKQLALPSITHISGLGEEIALKAQGADKRAQIRKCIGCMWDALTTVKYLLNHHEKETSEEQDILINRLDKTLEALGGARPTFSDEEILNMLKNRS